MNDDFVPGERGQTRLICAVAFFILRECYEGDAFKRKHSGEAPSEGWPELSPAPCRVGCCSGRLGTLSSAASHPPAPASMAHGWQAWSQAWWAADRHPSLRLLCFRREAL